MRATRFPRRLVIVAGAAAAVVAALVGVALYGLLLSPADPGTTAASGRSPLAPGPVSTGAPQSETVVRPPRIRATINPEAFARDVARALFDWDTALSLDPIDYAGAIVSVGDPRGEETAGLASDVRGYLPTPEAWDQLRAMQTRQSLDIERTYIPDSWADAIDQALPGQLLPGTVAYTVSGTALRDGIWGTDPVSSRRAVEFTVFIACEPSFRSCRLLRLSRPDEPLL